MYSKTMTATYDPENGMPASATSLWFGENPLADCQPNLPPAELAKMYQPQTLVDKAINNAGYNETCLYTYVQLLKNVNDVYTYSLSYWLTGGWTRLVLSWSKMSKIMTSFYYALSTMSSLISILK